MTGWKKKGEPRVLRSKSEGAAAEKGNWRETKATELRLSEGEATKREQRRKEGSFGLKDMGKKRTKRDGERAGG